MTANVLGSAWDDLRQSSAGKEAMQELQALLIAGEMASRERGPANGVLGDDLPGDPAKQERLRNARQRTDAAFDHLQQVLATASTARDNVSQSTQRAYRHLQNARQTVDATARKERSERSPEELHGAVAEMIGVIDDLAPGAIRLTNDAAASFPGSTDALIAARQAAALREFAGQLGSQFTAPLTKRKRLSPDERAAIDRLQGRIEQLRQQLTVGAAAAEARPAVQAATDNMLVRYFGSALPFVETLVEFGLQDGNYPVNTADFAARYVPDMDAIVNLRDVLLDEAMADARRGLSQARRTALWTGTGAAITLFLLGMTWWLLHRRVVLPLTKTTELIVTIAQGHLDVQIPSTKYHDEVANMLGAIGVLRDNSVARQTAEAAIREMAYYDLLTGLPNRRLLEDRMQQVLASAQRRSTKVSVLFIDLDKFKQVNDVHGHEAGDWLLQQVANRMRGVLRLSDTAARVGGDEFVVLLPDTIRTEDAVAVAEKIRQQMALPFVMDSGVTLDISSSIGIAMYPDQADTPNELLRFGDDAMYRAKKRGRNAVEVFAGKVDATADDDQQILRLVWKTAYASGNAMIDREHMELFHLANELIDLAVHKEVDHDRFNQVLDRLLTQVETHFGHEEALLNKVGYLDLEMHHQQHQALLAQVQALRQQSAEGHVPLERLMEFLAYELITQHITGEDQKFFPVLTN